MRKFSRKRKIGQQGFVDCCNLTSGFLRSQRLTSPDVPFGQFVQFVVVHTWFLNLAQVFCTIQLVWYAIFYSLISQLACFPCPV